MIVQFTCVDEYSKKAEEIINKLKSVGLEEGRDFKIYSDDVLPTSCPNCGDSEFWDMYDRRCNHCGYKG